MDYTINQLSKLTGLSTRALRYYDEIGLFVPASKTDAGYRVYSSAQLDTLQQIMFYKELGMQLEEIRNIVTSADFDSLKALEQHLIHLKEKQRHINGLIENVSKTIRVIKGETDMTDKERFETFKNKMISENEEKYGKEIREKYGDKTVDESNKKLLGMTQQQWNDIEQLNEALNNALKEAVQTADPAGEKAQYACGLHQQWIKHYWNFYSKEAHLGLCRMYTQDERFIEYYEKIAPGCADFLLKAMEIYLA